MDGEEAQQEEEVMQHWSSHDRFAAKLLHTLASTLVGEKRRIIQDGSAFRALLNVSPFNIPNALIDFVAAHTSPALREFKLGKKRILFTREMVKKVFGIRCGNRPVVPKKGEHPELRRMYIEAGQTRSFIQYAIDLLKKCDVTDDLFIIRTWDLICLATVLDPGSANCPNLEYLDCLLDPRRTDEYAWDEHLLDLAMKKVTKINTKSEEPLESANAKKYEFWITGPFVLLVIPYMDHLEFPPNQHAINYSTPRVCFVTNADFKFILRHDADRKMLNNKTVFGRRSFLPLADTPYGVVAPVPQQVEQNPDEPEVNPSASLNEWLVFPTSQDLEIPAKYKHLHEKHKVLFGIDVDTTLKNFGVGLKQMHSKRMVALLVDVDQAITNEDSPPVDPVNFSNGGGAEEAHQMAFDVGDGAGTVNDANVETTGAPDGHLVESEETEDTEIDGAADDYIVQKHINVLDEPQSAVILDSTSVGCDLGEQIAVESPLRSPRTSPYRSIPEGISEEEWNRAPDHPSFELWSQDPFDVSVVPSIHSIVENQAVASSDKPGDLETKTAAHLAEPPFATDSNKPEEIAISAEVSTPAMEVQAGDQLAHPPSPQPPIATDSNKPEEIAISAKVLTPAMEVQAGDQLAPPPSPQPPIATDSNKPVEVAVSAKFQPQLWKLILLRLCLLSIQAPQVLSQKKLVLV